MYDWDDGLKVVLKIFAFMIFIAGAICGSLVTLAILYATKVIGS